MRTTGESFTSNNNFKLGCLDPNETSSSKKPLAPEPALSKSNIYVSLDDEFDYMSQSQLFTSRIEDPAAFPQKDSNVVAQETGPTSTQTAPYPSPKCELYLPTNLTTNTSMVSKNSSPKDFDCQTLDSRKRFCYNCFIVVDGNGIEGGIQNEGFTGQVFCSKKCLKIQYLENSIFCANQACEKGHFLKPTGVLDNGAWYCSIECIEEESMRESRYGQYKSAGDDQEMVRDYEKMEGGNRSLVESIEESDGEESAGVDAGDIDLDFDVSEMGLGKPLF